MYILAHDLSDVNRIYHLFFLLTQLRGSLLLPCSNPYLSSFESKTAVSV